MDFTNNPNILIWSVIAVISFSWLVVDIFKKRPHHISTSQLVQLFNTEQALIIDTRDQAEWNKGHIAQAKHIPLGVLKNRLNEFKTKQTPVVLYCQHGHRSQEAVKIFKAEGFEKVYQLSGGFSAWVSAGLPSIMTK